MTQLKGGLLLKILKYFKAMIKIFEFFHVKEIVESWLVYVIDFSELSNHVSWRTQENKVSTSFFFLILRTPVREKIDFSWKIVIVINVVIFLHYKETN